jgi:hypothetical protein
MDLCVTKHITHKRQTSMSPPGFETTVPGSEGPQTQALDRAATGISQKCYSVVKYSVFLKIISEIYI